MPLTKLFPDSHGRRQHPATRDRAVDVARLAALMVVMFGHCALLLATIDSGGLRIGNLLGAVPALTPITWVVQVMPLFFLPGSCGSIRLAAWNILGNMAFIRAQRLADLSLALGGLERRLVRGEVDARTRVRGRHGPGVRCFAVVSGRLHRRARIRAGVDPIEFPAARRLWSSWRC